MTTETGPEDLADMGLDLALDRFLEAITAMRDLLAFAGAHEQALEGERPMSTFIEDYIRPMPQPRRRRALFLMVQWGQWNLRRFADPDEQSEIDERLASLRAQESAATEAGVEEQLSLPDLAQVNTELDAFSAVLDLLDDTEAMAAFAKAATYPRIGVHRAELLRTSLVTSAVTAFEVLLVAIATQYYKLHNDALGARNRRDADRDFSFEELKTYSSIQDAIDALIERRVDTLLRGGLDDWQAWFERNLRIALPEHSLDWPETVEVFQRRNLFVHTGGRVSKQYINVTGSTESRGAVVEADAQYVTRALDLLTTCGALLVIATKLQVLRDRAQDNIEEFNDLIYRDFMRRGHWAVVEKTCTFAAKHCERENIKHILKVNAWLGRKRTAGLSEEDRAKIERWDVSALSSEYHVAKSALLDDFDDLLPRLRAAVDTGDLDKRSLGRWPILAEARAHPKFYDFFPQSASDADDSAREFLSKRGREPQAN